MSQVRKRTRLLGVLLHWEQRLKAKATRGWLAQLVHHREKQSRAARAVRHYRTRVLRGAMGPWLELWQVKGSHILGHMPPPCHQMRSILMCI